MLVTLTFLAALAVEPVVTPTPAATPTPEATDTFAGAPPLSLKLLEKLKGLSTGSPVFITKKGEWRGTITSFRLLLQNASKKGKTFTPPPQLLFDVVEVQCGILESRKERYDCASVTVTDGSGATIEPLRTKSEVETAHNAFGATFQASIVKAYYNAHALKHGFIVAYVAPSGIGDDHTVKEDKAAKDLLLGIEE